MLLYHRTFTGGSVEKGFKVSVPWINFFIKRYTLSYMQCSQFEYLLKGQIFSVRLFVYCGPTVKIRCLSKPPPRKSPIHITVVNIL